MISCVCFYQFFSPLGIGFPKFSVWSDSRKVGMEVGGDTIHDSLWHDNFHLKIRSWFQGNPAAA